MNHLQQRKDMKRTVGYLLTFSCMVFLSGCATIVSGTTQKLSVSSNPSDAVAKVDNNLSAKTPTTFTLERKNDHTIEISKEGYKTAIVLIKRTFNGMMAGNILIGGIIGSGVDAVSGANNKLIPERIDVVLEEGEGYSDVPKFVAQKDQDFYDKSILNPEKTRKEKEAEKETTKKAKTAAIEPNTLGGPATNFSPNKAQ